MKCFNFVYVTYNFLYDYLYADLCDSYIRWHICIHRIYMPANIYIIFYMLHICTFRMGIVRAMHSIAR